MSGLHFDGTNCISAAGLTLAATMPISIFGQIRSATRAAQYSVAITNGATYNPRVDMVGNGSAYSAEYSQEPGFGTNATSPLAGSTAWEPFLLVFNNSLRRIFYSSADTTGASETFTFADMASTLTMLTIGGIIGNGGFVGDLEDVTIWSSDRSADWATLKGDVLPESVATASLIDHWHFNNLASTYTGLNGRVLTASGTNPLTLAAGPAPITRAAPSSSISGDAFGLPGVASGTLGQASVQAGVFLSDILTNNFNGLPLANVANIAVNFWNVADRTPIYRQTGLTSNAQGRVGFTSASLPPGSYLYEPDFSATTVPGRVLKTILVN